MTNRPKHPPQWVGRLLNRFLDRRLADAILGDLEEGFYEHLQQGNYQRARLKYLMDAIGFFRYYRLSKKRQTYQSRLNASAMFFNYLKTSLRSFSKRRAYFLLNVIGLSIGIASFLALQKYVEFEKSFDRFHPQPEAVKRVLRYNSNNNTYLATSDPNVAVEIKSQMPGFDAVTRFYIRDNGAFQVEQNGTNQNYEDFGLIYADIDFLSVFGFDFIDGNSTNPLEKPNSLVLTESMAMRLFGRSSVVGESLRFKDPNFPLLPLQVVAVVKDVPKNSHFRFDALMSINTTVRNGQSLDQLGWNAFSTYVRINDNFNIEAATAQLEQLARQHYPNNENLHLDFQNLTDIHLNSGGLFGLDQGADKRLVNYLSLTSLFILLMAYFNYINFSTAKSLERAKEVGVRKVLGSHKSHLVGQFLTETLLINLIALVLSLFLLLLLAPVIPMGTIDFSWQGLFVFYGKEGLLLAGALILGTLLSGFYPALIMSSWKPTTALKGKLSQARGGKTMRGILTTVQSVVSLMLIVITSVIYSQIDFMMKQDKGMNIDHVLVVETPTIRGTDYRNQLQTYRNKLMANPYVKSVSTASTLPGSSLNYATPIRKVSQPIRESVRIFTDGIDEGFIDHYDIGLLEGRVFNSAFNERRNAVINATASQLLGFDSPADALQQKLIMENDTVAIIGVIADYNHYSLKEDFTPQIFRYYGSWMPRFSIKVNYNESISWQGLITQLEADYHDAFGENLFDYHFLDQQFDTQYAEDRRFGSISGFFSGIAIVIAILGLLGFIAFTISVKSKEIAVRKVLGARRRSIILQLSKGTLLLNMLAGVIATALAWFYLNDWLGQYAFQLKLGIWHFALPILGLLGIIVLIIVVQSLSLLRKTPVSAINQEG